MVEITSPKPKIKVLEIITALPIGGAERLLFDICRKLDQDKFEVSVLCVVRGGDLFYQFREAGIPVKVIGKEGKFGGKCFYRIWREIKEKRPEVVHTHLFAADLWGAIAARLAGVKKIIATRHNLMNDEGWVKLKIEIFLYRWVFTKIIAISAAVRKDILTYNPKLESKLKLVYNGVDQVKFTINNYQWHEPPVIGIIGRLTQQKGHRYFLEALNLIKNLPWQAKIIGDGELRAELVRLVQDFGLSSQVVFTGNILDMSEELPQIDIICAPSVFEGLNLSVIEGMFARKPAVAFRVNGLMEVVDDGKTGILVDYLNVQELAAGLKDLITNENKAKIMGAAGRKRAAEMFNLDQMINEYQEIYLS